MRNIKRFFVFEGVDGSGKSSTLSLVKERFEKLKTHYKVHTSKEPNYNTPIGEAIHHYLKLFSHVEFDEYDAMMMLLFSADRCLHVHGPEGIIKTLEGDKKNIVISDRYMMSHFAYNVPEYVKEPQQNIIKYNWFFPYPQCTFYFKVDAKVALERILNRGGTQLHRNEDIQALKKAVKNYDFIMERLINDKLPIKIINANAPQNEVVEEVVSHLNEIL